METSKREHLREIYEMLKLEGEEVISAHKIDLHSLPTDILEVLSPLLCEMEELSTTLSLEEFLDAALRLYNVRIAELILGYSR